MSDALRKAREYEAAHLPEVPAEALPVYHVTGGVGWINDPNGFSRYQGDYHLFYQYHPYSKQWGPMHWGHVKSKDLIRWERLPAAMAPDTDADRDGCFSGSAIEFADGRHVLIYTGVRKFSDGDEVQTQCLAFGDGVNYEKYEGNPVIDGSLLPEGGSRRDFRDPKIWREGDSFFAVAGDRAADGTGTILLFESKDLLHWEFRSVVAASKGRYGRMWECPDLFQLDGKHVLITSPQEMTESGLDFIEGNCTLCLIGTLNPYTLTFSEERPQTIDYGLDFYAPQTLLTEDGRRVMIGWMQYWGSVDAAPEELPFFGQMTVPRELRVKGDKLIQNPVRELERYRRNPKRFECVLITDETALPEVSGRCLDLTLTIRGDYRYFRLCAAKDSEHETVIRYDRKQSTVTVDRSKSGFAPEIRNVRSFRVQERNGLLKFRLLLDRFSLELFVNDGEQAASFTVYTPQSAKDITFAAEGTAVLDADFYELEVSEDGETL